MPAPDRDASSSESTQVLSSASTTIVRAALGLAAEVGLHPQVRSLVREAALRSGAEAPDLGVVLTLVSQQFEAMDADRRGIVQ
ncbi:MAG: hypothetical protein GJU76_08720, partial [Gallionella sp.]|nr:hypothetical protein [Gallionella sp.]